MRPFIEHLQRYFRGKQLTGVEIGVYTGANALAMLSNLNIQKLYLIDPYSAYPGYSETELGFKGQVTPLSSAYEQALANLCAYKDKPVFIKQKSQDAVSQIPEVDFVYIDGNHTYDYVKQDLGLYYPKVKTGGIIGGDNIELPDVRKAIGEFAAKYQLHLNIGDYAYYIEWWVIKR